jgi:hypothetical protein
MAGGNGPTKYEAKKKAAAPRRRSTKKPAYRTKTASNEKSKIGEKKRTKRA